MSRVFAAVCLAALGPLALRSNAAELPAGSILSVRLTSRISSHWSLAGQPVDGVLIAPVRQGDQTIVAPGARLLGHVVEARGGFGRRAVLKLRFDRLIAASGTGVDIETHVIDVDNAREEVSPDGTIRGLAPLLSPPSNLHLLLLLAAHAHPVILATMEIGRFAKKEGQHPTIEYAPGVELDLALDRPVSIPGAGVPEARPLPRGLARVIEGLPLQTVAAKVGRPSDITNVLIVGSQADLESAFAAAGWTRAERMRARTAAKGFLALAEKHAYRRAPVSLLELQGRPPDLVLEKDCNTLAKRHHVRFWGGFTDAEGRPAWLGAVTHDIGIAFSRRERTFTHRIDTRIDLERTKVVDDLLFTGQVGASGIVDRPLAPRSFTTATGAQVETDGGIAVLILAGPQSNPIAGSRGRP